MKRWSWWAAGIAAYLAILVALAPASLLDVIAAQATGGRLRIAAASGSLWTGAGELQFFDAVKQQAVGKSVAWRISPWSLFGGRLACAMALDANPHSFELIVYPSRVELANADISVPAEVLAIADVRLAPFALAGDLEFRISRLTVGRSGADGNGIVLWRRAASAHSKVMPLGDYELTVTSSEGTAAFTLRTIQGALQLDGAGSWPRGAKPEFRASARAEPQYREQLEPFMRMIAVDRGGGIYELQLK